MLYRSKKAMSPLIATVLLIAFAVALGTMIMNWGVEETRKSQVVQVGVDTTCRALASMSLQGPACYQDNKVKFTAKNIGVDRIDGVRLQVESADGNFQFDVRNSGMVSGESIDKEIPMLKPEGDVSLYFIPLVSQQGTIVECYVGQHEQNGLPRCS